MNPIVIQKLILSTIVLTLIVVIFHLFKLYAKRTQQRMNLQISRYYSLKRIMILFSLILFFISLITIWGINIEKAWISLTGFVAMIAIAFFAIWSLIGNILAGMILFFTTPFKTNDTIEIMPDEIKGEVLAVNFFYTLIEDEHGYHISVPNSLFFQKYIKKYT